ncbi:MAG: nuclear transport factor 2 family protein [Mycetocola sp.]
MNSPSASVLTGMERLELELIVRDFTASLNDGVSRDLIGFLHEDVVYKSSSKHVVRGRADVLALLRDIRSTFAVVEIRLENVGIEGDVVVAEQDVDLAVRGALRRRIIGFASYRFVDRQIAEWHHLHA